MIKFILIVVSVFTIFHIISYHALIKPMLKNLSIKYKIIGITLLILNFIVIIVFILIRRLDLPHTVFASLTIPILIMLLLFCASLLNVIFLIISKFIKNFPIIIISRSLFVVAIFGVCFGIYGASKIPQITNQTIEIKNLREDMTILQIADLHLSGLISSKKVKKIVELSNSTNPDIIVLVGDIIDAKEEHIKDSLEELKKLKAKHGVYFVLGNHEFIFNAHNSIRIINELGNITTLVNSNITINDNINLIGLSDMMGFSTGYLEPDINQSMQGVKDSLPNIMLSHQPEIIKMLDSNIDLVLSGHTHGGQIFPFSLIVYLVNPFLYGLKEINGIQMHITKGASLAVTYGRIGADSEINLLTLKGKEK